MESPHDNGIMHWNHEPGHIGGAALPRRPNSAGTSTATFRPLCVTGIVSSRAGTRVTEKWDARQRIPTGKGARPQKY